MRRVLITGQRSYVGTQLKQWLAQWQDEFEVTTISVRNSEWKLLDFTKFDVVVHAAALVHKKEKLTMREEYFRVNSDLTYELAVKAKQSGVKHFIFLSTISVYGLEGEIGKSVEINRDTPLSPKSYYGESKLDAENRIHSLQDECFHISILRVPMIYGPSCPGNYAKLRKLVLKAPVLPRINNQRSVIFSDHLSEFIRLLINKGTSGLFHPQNRDLFSTVDVVTKLAKIHNKRVWIVKGLGFAGRKLLKRVTIANKLFGNLTIDPSISNLEFGYSIVSFDESLVKSEQGFGLQKE